MLHRPRIALNAVLGLLVVLLSLGAAPALAADYPLPTHGMGKVDKSIVFAGDCVIFSGGGFEPGASLTITDDGHVVGHTKADGNGNFRHKVCFPTNAKLGRHVLTAYGTGANGAARDVTATVTVVGVSIQRPPPGAVVGPGGGNPGAPGAGGGLPFTGADIRNLVLLGLLLSLVGALLVAHDNRARRRRRISRLSV